MAQWKLVPVEPTPEMLKAGEGAAGEQDVAVMLAGGKSSVDNVYCGPVYAAMLSAAPSPDGDEDEVERVADAIIAAQAGPAKKLSDITSPYGRDYELRKARAAISAMRPAPKLTEGDMARVEEISEIAEFGEGYADIPGRCPFCGQDPYHRTEFGEPVGIVCCEPMAWLHDNSEEDAEIREAVTALICKVGGLKQAARETLSLIDKLTEAG